MDHRHLKSTQNVHALGVRYVSNFLHRVGFTIHEVNTDPDHHFQLLTKRKNRTMLINVRTAYYPDVGTLDKATQEQLINESEQLSAIPHFAGLSITELETNNIEVDRFTEDREYKFTFYGITVVHKSELLAVNQ